MKLKYVCKRVGTIGDCHYIIEVGHFKELIEAIEEHEGKFHKQKEK